MTRLRQLTDGSFVVPGNRFDLVPGQPERPPQVSVVIPYFQQQAGLDLVLTALGCQTHPASRLEVIVADDGSRRPPDVGAGAGLTVTVVRQDRDGFRAAAARNLGAAAAAGTILCFLDGDTVPAPDYLANAIRLPALLPDALVVGRRGHRDLSGWTPSRLRAWLAGGPAPPPLPDPAWLSDGYASSRNLLDADDRSFRYVISAVLTMGTGLFRDLGGFDPAFTSYGGEDWELGYRAWNAGAVLAHEPAALAWHDGPDWAGRGGDPGAKNRETLALARLIPEPHTRGRGIRWPWPDVVVQVRAGTGAAVVATVDALLRHRDVGVWVPATEPAFEADPRVRVGEPSAQVLARARRRVHVAGPCTLDLDRLLAPLDEGSVGRVTVRDGGGVLATATAARAQARAQRWRAALPADGIAALFDTLTVGAEEVGAVRIDDTPDLAAIFAGP